MSNGEQTPIFFIDEDPTNWADVADALALAAAEGGAVTLWSNDDGRLTAQYSSATCLLRASWDEGDHDRVYEAELDHTAAHDAVKVFLAARCLDATANWRRRL